MTTRHLWSLISVGICVCVAITNSQDLTHVLGEEQEDPHPECYHEGYLAGLKAANAISTGRSIVVDQKTASRVNTEQQKSPGEIEERSLEQTEKLMARSMRKAERQISRTKRAEKLKRAKGNSQGKGNSQRKGKQTTEPETISSSSPASDLPPSDLNLIGCFKDQADRDLEYMRPIENPRWYGYRGVTTAYECQVHCRAKGYKFFGLQTRNKCFCGNTFGKYGETACVDCPSSRSELFWDAGEGTNCIYNTTVPGSASDPTPNPQKCNPSICDDPNCVWAEESVRELGAGKGKPEKATKAKPENPGQGGTATSEKNLLGTVLPKLLCNHQTTPATSLCAKSLTGTCGMVKGKCRDIDFARARSPMEVKWYQFGGAGEKSQYKNQNGVIESVCHPDAVKDGICSNDVVLNTSSSGQPTIRYNHDVFPCYPFSHHAWQNYVTAIPILHAGNRTKAGKVIMKPGFYRSRSSMFFMHKRTICLGTGSALDCYTNKLAKCFTCRSQSHLRHLKNPDSYTDTHWDTAHFMRCPETEPCSQPSILQKFEEFAAGF